MWDFILIFFDQPHINRVCFISVDTTVPQVLKDGQIGSIQPAGRSRSTHLKHTHINKHGGKL